MTNPVTDPPEDPKPDSVVPDEVPDVTPDTPADEAPAVPDKDNDSDSDDGLKGMVERLQETVNGLSEQVAALAPVPVVDPEPEPRDLTPTKRPWTHKGFGRKDRDD